MVRPEAVIFDIGNVLIEWQPESYFDRIMGASDRTRMFAEVDLHAMNEAIDSGAPFRATVETWAARYPCWAEMIHHWHDHWADLAAPAILPVVATLRALRARNVPVFILSNIGEETFAIATSRYAVLTEADRFYLSGRLQVTKPDPRIYELVEVDCGIAPGQLLFVDDRQQNINAAVARGWRGHRFDGPTGWTARLCAEGLLHPEDIT